MYKSKNEKSKTNIMSLIGSICTKESIIMRNIAIQKNNAILKRIESECTEYVNQKSSDIKLRQLEKRHMKLQELNFFINRELEECAKHNNES